MTDELEPLAPELYIALEVERARPPPPADQLARLAARLDATFTPPTPPSVATPAGNAVSAGLATKVGLLAAGLLIGTVAGSQLQLHFGPQREVIVEKVVEVPVRVEVQVPVPVPADPAPIAKPPVPAAKEKETARSPIELERLLVEQATAALGRGKGEDALAACREHATRFPSGQLAEEREIVAIRALMLLGRRADAVARADGVPREVPREFVDRRGAGSGALKCARYAPLPDPLPAGAGRGRKRCATSCTG
jgi:hypothetical protein